MNFKPLDIWINTDNVVFRVIFYLNFGFAVCFFVSGLISKLDVYVVVLGSLFFLLFAFLFKMKPWGLYKWLKKRGVEFIDEDYLGVENMVLVKDGNSALGVFYIDDDGCRLFLLEPEYANIETEGDFFIMTDFSGRCGAFNYKRKKMAADCVYNTLKINEQGDIEAYSEDKLIIISPDGIVLMTH